MIDSLIVHNKVALKDLNLSLIIPCEDYLTFQTTKS